MPSVRPNSRSAAGPAGTWVVPKEGRCIQCGICSFYCPMAIDVRRYVWHGEPVTDSRCITCGECVKRCPRSLLSFGVMSASQPRRTDPVVAPTQGMRHVLIGAGPAAITAAQAIRSADQSAHITMVTSDPHGYYSRPGLAYFLAEEEPERQLFPFSAAELQRLGIDVVRDHAVGIERDARIVRLQGGVSLPYDRLLLATGSTALPLRAPGADLRGVEKLDDLEDARELVLGQRVRSAVVVGGGSTALEVVEGLCERGVRVHYFLRKGRYWSDVLAESESRIVEQALQDRGVDVRYFTQVDEVLGKSGSVSGVRTDAGETLRCDLLAVAIGVAPRKELAEQAGLACGRGVLVDEHLRTADEHIFAAGDVSEIVETDGHHALDVLWSSAVEEGRVAGLNMVAGPHDKCRKDVPLNVTRLAGHKVTIIGTVGRGHDSDLAGLSRGDSEQWRELGAATSIEQQTRHAHVRLEVSEGRIDGAVVMGDQTLSFPLQDLIAERVDVTPIAEQLRAPNAPLGEIICAYHRDWQVRRA